MKRDMDLVRRILLIVEEHGDPFNFKPLQIEGHEDRAVAYHVGILHGGGYLEASDQLTTMGSQWKVWAPKTLTWAGHDYLDSIRNDTVWQKVKARLAEVGGDAPVEVIKAIAVKVLTETLGLGT